MKRIGWMLLGGGMAVAAIAIILVVQVLKPTFSTASELTKAEAQQVAEQRYSGTVTDIRQHKEQFTIELERETGIYELRIDAKTGEISSLRLIKQKDPSHVAVEEPDEREVLHEEQIKEIARQHANGEVQSVEAMTKENETVYQVTVQDEKSKTTFSIDARTGEVLQKDSQLITEEKPSAIEKDSQAIAEGKADSTQNGSQPIMEEKPSASQKGSQPITEEKPSTVQKDPQPVTEEKPNTSQKKPQRITEQEAISLALKQVPGTVDDVDIETINGIVYYLIEIESSDDREATVEINGITREIKSVTWDNDDDSDDDDDDDDD